MADDRTPVWGQGQQDDRDRWQIQQYGHVRDGFRTDFDRTDERPLLIYPYPFWSSSEEEARWERAVRACPLSQYGSLDVFAYLEEVGRVATGLRPSGGVVKGMPEVVR